MTYIQDISVRGMGGKKTLDMTFTPLDNLIFEGCGDAAAGPAVPLKYLNSVLKMDSTMLLSLHFEEIRVRISGENGIVYTCRISKKDISIGEAARVGKEADSAWRIDPAPRGMETPVWPHLHLPASRDYTPRHRRARPTPREGRPPANHLDNKLYALRKDYFLDASARYDRALRRGAVDALKAVFSKHEREKGGD